VSQAPDPAQPARTPAPRDDAVTVISAYGAFRLLLILMAIWSFFEGFALFFGQGGLLAWRRERYRALMWIPYAAQLAMILPLGISLLRLQNVGILLFVVSLVFFSLLVYFWWQSRPLEFFQKKDELGASPDEDEEEEDEDDEDDDTTATSGPDITTRRRYRRQ
jgi:hypothetical protein